MPRHHAWRPRVYPLSIIAVSFFSSIFSPVQAYQEPYRQTFVVTAYYSPLPGQTAYFRGSYEADIEFNGQGIRGADGTPVYPGMIAAPPTYPFGSVIELDDVGIGTVHDRGGRIIEWGEDLHRIDLWMGSGDEGLARALAWGVRTVQGTVYPVGSSTTPKESFDLTRFPSNPSALASLPATDPVDQLIGLALGDRGIRVRVLQDRLRDARVFDAASTGEYGPVTQESVRRFLALVGLRSDGAHIDERTAAMLTLWPALGPHNLPVVPIGLSQGSDGQDVRQAQKLLRYLGYYRGRTHGIFDDRLRESVIAFQVAQGVIADRSDPSAGRMGPATQREIRTLWQAKVTLAKAERLTLKRSLAKEVVAEALPSRVLVKGSRGSDVRQLQRLLVDRGYLPSTDVTGTYGERTAAAILRYQIDAGILSTPNEHGAGVYGPATRAALGHDIVEMAWQRVRAGA